MTFAHLLYGIIKNPVVDGTPMKPLESDEELVWVKSANGGLYLIRRKKK